MSTLVHRMPGSFATDQIRVVVVGAGGNGAQVLIGLGRLHVTMKALGHPKGLHVVAYDDDVVEAHNVGRQPFYESDVGRAKVDVLINRLNIAYGLDWEAAAERYGPKGHRSFNALYVGCVDSKSARRVIAEAVHGSSSYWLDLGNNATGGQVMLGKDVRGREDLPMPSTLLPELVEGEDDTETPTCSVAASVARQGLFVNQMAATWALLMLDTLFRTGELSWHGVFFDTATGRTNRLPVDPEVWARMQGDRLPKPD